MEYTTKDLEKDIFAQANAISETATRAYKAGYEQCKKDIEAEKEKDWEKEAASFEPKP